MGLALRNFLTPQVILMNSHSWEPLLSLLPHWDGEKKVHHDGGMWGTKLGTVIWKERWAEQKVLLAKPQPPGTPVRASRDGIYLVRAPQLRAWPSILHIREYQLSAAQSLRNLSQWLDLQNSEVWARMPMNAFPKRDILA